jgi:hypothetical protein
MKPQADFKSCLEKFVSISEEFKRTCICYKRILIYEGISYTSQDANSRLCSGC